jgi:glucosamine-6-phosphate deaminase
MEVLLFDSADQIARAAAQRVATVVRDKPHAVLGLATGSTPLALYRELIRLHRDESLDFSGVTTFNLDEYIGLASDHPQSYHRFMHEHLFAHLNVAAANINIPSGTASDFRAFCRDYEQRIVDRGRIDLQILGIGTDGHIAFNEPGSSLGSRTRIKTLAQQTIADNARFFGRPEDVPIYAVTMGVGTILEAREILLLATGQHKADAVAAAIEGPVTSLCTASALQMHRDTRFYLDRPAASKLKLIDYYEWIQKHREGAPG